MLLGLLFWGQVLQLISIFQILTKAQDLQSIVDITDMKNRIGNSRASKADTNYLAFIAKRYKTLFLKILSIIFIGREPFQDFNAV